ncbi:MAG: DUF928 domain-containing protein [Cyanobacteria bacterium J06635_10]
MKNKNPNQIKFCFIILLTLISFTRLSQPVIAHSQRQISRNHGKIPIQLKKKQEDGSDRGRPTKREGMGSRDNCPSTDIPLTALIPENKVSKVVEANPKFWLFIAYQASNIPTGEFVLQDEAHNDVYRTNFSVEKGEGIVSISLGSGKTLETNKIYQWYFKLYCHASGDALGAYRDKSSVPIYVRGWVKRVALQPLQKKQLSAATSPRQLVAFYAQNGIWYSALTELAKLRQENPGNRIFARDWLQLLRDIGLQELSNMPIVGNIN